MANNRQIVFVTDKSLKNMEVKINSSTKPYFRAALPSFDPKDGKINTKLLDKQNVFIEGEDHAEGDVLNGTYRFGLRFYSQKADGTERPEAERFFRWELLEEVNVDAERSEAIHVAKLALMKKQSATTGKAIAETEEITDKW